jgi:hypothetical protein
MRAVLTDLSRGIQSGIDGASRLGLIRLVSFAEIRKE